MVALAEFLFQTGSIKRYSPARYVKELENPFLFQTGSIKRLPESGPAGYL